MRMLRESGGRAFELSDHAEEALGERHIPLALAEAVLDCPEEVTTERGGRRAYQSELAFPNGKRYLLRVIVDENCEPAVVVTVYRTTRVAKYRRT